MCLFCYSQNLYYLCIVKTFLIENIYEKNYLIFWFAP